MITALNIMHTVSNYFFGSNQKYCWRNNIKLHCKIFIEYLRELALNWMLSQEKLGKLVNDLISNNLGDSGSLTSYSSSSIENLVL